MVKDGLKGVRAAFADATAKLARSVDKPDPPPDTPRVLMVGGKETETRAGEWPGAPVDRMPPSCDVVPLGVNGHTSFFVDGLGQILDFEKLGHDDLLKLFRMTPHQLEFYWPKWSTPKGDKRPRINGCEVRKAAACLFKAAGDRGLFDPAGRVRGRGAWSDKFGRLIWHSGDALWIVDGKKLKVSGTGEIDGIFYPRRPTVLEPWREPVPVSESPASKIVDCLTSWSWDRPQLDPVIALGGIGTMLLSGALPWRSHVALMGERGTGKSQLQKLIKGILGDVLIDAANATEAGIRQHMGLDALPVGIDEFEASDDNRRSNAIIELARIASSGGRLLRGGQDHKGVEFHARNAFFCSGILLPPMKAQDKSRFALLNLDRLQVGDKDPPTIEEHDGRMLLRALMDAWPTFDKVYYEWRALLRHSGLDGRAQDTYGTLLTVAQLMLGEEKLEALGLPIADGAQLGELIAQATAEERGAQVDDWRACLEHLLGAPVEAIMGGERPSIGTLIEEIEKDQQIFELARSKLAAAGVSVQEEPAPDLPAGRRRFLLCVPIQNSPPVAALFANTRWRDGGWAGALKKGRSASVVRPGDRVVSIKRAKMRCLVIDLLAYDKAVEAVS